jgi:hypothetical protein
MKNKETSSTFKALAIIGFAATIIIVAWLSIQLVNILPNAFNSLASLREAINQQSEIIADREDDEILDVLSVTSNVNVVNTDDSLSLTWDTANINGTYSFYYLCEDGVSLSIINSSTGLRAISCDTNYNIGNIDVLNLRVESENNRFATVDYQISFLAENDINPSAVGSSSFTVVNTAILDISLVDDEETEEVDTETNTPPPTTQPTAPVYEQEFIYAIPTSDPNGKTDLATRYLFAGSINNSRFVPGAIEQNDSGAIQFEVKNLGTKTSDEWTYSMTLPTGSSYKSDDQKPLEPNQRALITIGFPTSDEDNFSFRVTIDEDTDRNSNNDRFTHRVNFIN